MAPILRFSERTFRTYAKRHGYDYIVGSGDSRERPAAWGKILLLRKLLDSYETVFWIDADTVILNPDTDIATQLEPGDYQALATHPWDKRRYANTGVWVLRGERAKQFLDAIWADTAFIDHRWWENAAALRLLGYELDPDSPVTESEWTQGTCWLDDEWNDSVVTSGITPGPRIRHYAGQTNGYRLQRLRIEAAAAEPGLLAPAKIVGRTLQLVASGQYRTRS